MQIKTTMICLLTPTGWPESKSLTLISIVRGVEKLQSLCTVGGTVNWCGCCGKQFGGFKKWNRITPWSSYFTTRYRLKGLKTGVKKKPCTWVFIAKLWTFTIARRCKQPKCSLTSGWINKLWHVHIVENYSAIKKNEDLIHATAWMNLKDIILSERSYTSKAT